MVALLAGLLAVASAAAEEASDRSTRYLGCFANRITEDAQAGLTDASMSIDMCAAYCKDDAFFGIHDGVNCLCESSARFAEQGMVTSGGGCNVSCPGDDAMRACGGRHASSVFVRVGHFAHVGCFDIDIGSGIGGLGSSGHVVVVEEDTDDDDALSSSAMSINLCAAHCSRSRHFALQNGTQCSCGASVLASTGALSDSCLTPCGGEADDRQCGSPNVRSVFVRVKPFVPLGCFKDLPSMRALPIAKTTTTSMPTSTLDTDAGNGIGTTAALESVLRQRMTVELCGALCTGYAYFGVQSGGQCFCGNSGFDMHGRSNECVVPCPADERQICGGRHANVVQAFAGKVNPSASALDTARNYVDSVQMQLDADLAIFDVVFRELSSDVDTLRETLVDLAHGTGAEFDVLRAKVDQLNTSRDVHVRSFKRAVGRLRSLQPVRKLFANVKNKLKKLGIN